MVSAKRLIAAAGGLAAAMALFGCAANGTNGYADADKAVPVNAEASPSASPSPSPSASPSPAPAVPAGILVSSLKAVSLPRMGKVVTDDKGWVLYRFDKDTAKPPTTACEGKCAQTWPPVLTESTPTIQGIDPTKIGTIRRNDGGTQVTLNGWPLYRYIGDPKPGAWKGQAVGGTWWVIAPDGSKNLTCVPSGTPTPVAPPADAPGGGTSGAAGGTYNNY